MKTKIAILALFCLILTGCPSNSQKADLELHAVGTSFDKIGAYNGMAQNANQAIFNGTRDPAVKANANLATQAHKAISTEVTSGNKSVSELQNSVSGLKTQIPLHPE